ncbi:MAG: hypothetical protein GXY50_06155 [Syntrophomonadaceae bacterium]|nr:hypothetical protein [Syntrophomonadaceae bacterium]
MDSGQNDRNQIRERIRELINTQREFNEQVQQFRQEIGDQEMKRILEEVSRQGQANIQKLSRLLAVKCIV